MELQEKMWRCGVMVRLRPPASHAAANPPMTMGLNRAPARLRLLKIEGCLSALSGTLKLLHPQERSVPGKWSRRWLQLKQMRCLESCWCWGTRPIASEDLRAGENHVWLHQQSHNYPEKRHPAFIICFEHCCWSRSLLRNPRSGAALECFVSHPSCVRERGRG
jgi:hypothetical protein